jgi:hypothetical protein
MLGIKMMGEEDIPSIQKLALMCPMHGGFMICMEMCGNGVWIGMGA